MDSDSSASSDSPIPYAAYWRLKSRYNEVLESNSQMVLRLEEAKVMLSKSSKDLQSQNSVLMSENMNLRAQKEYLVQQLGEFRLLEEMLTEEMEIQKCSMERQKGFLAQFSSQVAAAAKNKDNDLKVPEGSGNEKFMLNPTALREVDNEPKASNIGSYYLPTINEEKSHVNGGEHEKVDDEDSFNTNSTLPRQSEILESISEEQKFVQPAENTKPAGYIVSKIGKRQSSVRAKRDTDKDTFPQRGRKMNEMDIPLGPEAPELPTVIFGNEFDRENDKKPRSFPENQSGIVEHTYGGANCTEKNELINSTNHEMVRMKPSTLSQEKCKYSNLDCYICSCVRCTSTMYRSHEISKEKRDDESSSKKGSKMPQEAPTVATSYQEKNEETELGAPVCFESQTGRTTLTELKPMHTEIELPVQSTVEKSFARLKNLHGGAQVQNINHHRTARISDEALASEDWQNQAEREELENRCRQPTSITSIGNGAETTYKTEGDATKKSLFNGNDENLDLRATSPCLSMTGMELPTTRILRISEISNQLEDHRLSMASSVGDSCNFVTPKVKRRERGLGPVGRKRLASLLMESALIVGDVSAEMLQENGPRMTRARSKPRRNPTGAINLPSKTDVDDANCVSEVKTPVKRHRGRSKK